MRAGDDWLLVLPQQLVPGGLEDAVILSDRVRLAMRGAMQKVVEGQSANPARPYGEARRAAVRVAS